MIADDELLRRYAEHRDEDAFCALVERHAALVLGTARRSTGDIESARDAAQQVFTLLARRAARLHREDGTGLAGWLHRTALLTATNTRRTENRRRIRHHAFAEDMKSSSDVPGADHAAWQEALPFLDAAINSLSAADREVVLGHYFERRTFRDLAGAAGKSDHALQKRAARALQKLSVYFRRRGILLSVTALAGGLPVHTAEAVAADYAAGTAAVAVKSASGLSAASVFTNTIVTMTLTKITTFAAIAAFLVPAAWPQRQERPAVAVLATSATSGSASVPVTTSPLRSVDGLKPPNTASLLNPLSQLAAEMAELDATNDAVQMLRVKRLILELAADELPGALDLVKSLRKADALDLCRAVFGRWGEVDPEKGLAAAREPSTIEWREARLAASGEPAMPTLGLFETWVLRDPDAAFAAALEWDTHDVVRDGRHRQEIPDMLGSLAVRDPERALQLAATLTDESVRQPATGSIQQMWAQHDPEAALRWISENTPDETRPRDMAFLLRSITASQPDRALTLALTLENPHARAEAADFAISNWAVDQPRAALEAMLRLPDEVLTEHIVHHAAVFMVGEDHGFMAQAAERLPEGPRRDIFVEMVVRCWPSGDNTDRQSWLNRAPISESARREILQSINEP
jgi:RNA polymerase sigma factor (sigma-70 family)